MFLWHKHLFALLVVIIPRERSETEVAIRWLYFSKCKDKVIIKVVIMFSSNTACNPLKSWSASHVAEQLWPIQVGGYRVHWKTTPEKINGAYLLGEMVWLIIIFNCVTELWKGWIWKPVYLWLLCLFPNSDSQLWLSTHNFW